MKPEDQFLLGCMRAHFGAEDQKRVVELGQQTPLDWAAIYATAQEHGVAPLIYHNLQPYNPSTFGLLPSVWQQFERAAYRNIALMSGMAIKLQAILAFFNAKSIDVMLVKGVALDMLVYDQPWYTLHDVDLVIRPRRAELSTAEQQAIDARFEQLPGFEYDFCAHHDVIMNGVLPIDFARIWADAVKTTYRDQTVFVMCPEDLLLAACINSCRKRYFRLKSLLDIAEIINTYQGLDWKVLVEKARVYDVHLIVYTALSITQRTVGCAMPAKVLAELSVPAWRARLIQEISRQLSLSAFSSLTANYRLFGRSLALPLVLPYVTLHGYQIARRLRYVWRTRAESGVYR
jgi:hypothetical protein